MAGKTRNVLSTLSLGRSPNGLLTYSLRRQSKATSSRRSCRSRLTTFVSTETPSPCELSKSVFGVESR